MKKRYFITTAFGIALLGIGLVQPLVQQSMAQGTTSKERGQQVFEYWCTPCHAPGPGHPGTQSLAIKYRDTDIPPVLEDRQDLVPDYVKTIVRVGIMSMAPFRKTEITDAELEDIAAYLAD